MSSPSTSSWGGRWGELEGMFEKASYWYKTKYSGKVTCTWGLNSLKCTPCWQARKDISKARKPKQPRTELLDAEDDGSMQHPAFSFAAVFCITDANLKAYSGRDVHLCNCWTVHHSCCVGVECSFISNFCFILCVCVCVCLSVCFNSVHYRFARNSEKPAIRVLSISELFQNTTTVNLPLWPCDIPTRNDTSVMDNE